MAPTWVRDDDHEPDRLRQFSRADEIKLRELLTAVEEGHLLHFSDPEQLEVFKRVMRTFTDHRDEIREIIAREQVNTMMTKVRTARLEFIKAALGFIIVLGGAVSILITWFSWVYPGSGK